MTPILAVEFSDGIQEAWNQIATFVPKFVGFLVILVIGWLIAKALSTLTNRILERVGFDRAVERGGIRRALDRTEYDASDLLAKIVYYVILLFTLQLAFGLFGPNPVSDLLRSVVAYLPKLFVAIVIVVLAAAIASAVRDIVQGALGGLSYGSTVASVAGGVILVIGVFAALNQLEIAEPIVNGLFYAILAIIVGVAVVAVGGSGIGPLRQRWEATLRRYDEEKQRVRRELDDGPASAGVTSASPTAPRRPAEPTANLHTEEPPPPPRRA